MENRTNNTKATNTRQNLCAILKALRAHDIKAEVAGGGAAGNEWVEMSMPAEQTLCIGYTEGPWDNGPALLVFNVLDATGDSIQDGTVDIGDDDPEGVANWVVGFLGRTTP